MKARELLLLVLLMSLPQGAMAVTPPIARSAWPAPPLTRHTLIVTHASRVFEPTGAIEKGLNAVVAKFRAAGLPIVYLMNDDGQGDALWLAADRAPDFAFPSTSGEHRLEVDTPQITVAGGYLELCQADTVVRAATSFFARNPRARDFVVHYPMDATYSEKYAYRASGEDSPPFMELLGFDHDPTPEEVLAKLGRKAFLGAVQSNLQLVTERFHYAILMDGEQGPTGGAGTRTVHFDFASANAAP